MTNSITDTFTSVLTRLRNLYPGSVIDYGVLTINGEDVANYREPEGLDPVQIELTVLHFYVHGANYYTSVILRKGIPTPCLLNNEYGISLDFVNLGSGYSFEVRVKGNQLTRGSFVCNEDPYSLSNAYGQARKCVSLVYRTINTNEKVKRAISAKVRVAVSSIEVYDANDTVVWIKFENDKHFGYASLSISDDSVIKLKSVEY